MSVPDRTDILSMCKVENCGNCVLEDGSVYDVTDCDIYNTECCLLRTQENFNEGKVYAFRLSTGEVCVVDLEDKEKVYGRSWYTDKHGHVCGKFGKNTTLIHRRVTGSTDPKVLIDHESRDKLDNRKCNLRTATSAQNRHNTVKHRGSSKYLGVSWDKTRNKWRAMVQWRDKGERMCKSLGVFDNEEDAAAKYNDAITNPSKYGLNFDPRTFARLNEAIKSIDT